MINKVKLMLLGAVVVTTTVVAAEEIMQSGFMTDYSQLTRISDATADYRYVAEDAPDRVAKYDAVMIDQPEIFIAADSPYRGVKPKHLDALAEAVRAGMASALSEDFYIVDKPGANVMFISPALSNVKLTKKKKSILGFTPIGLVGGAVAGAATTDIAKKANLQDVIIEIEIFDSMTGDRLIALIDHRGEGKHAPTNWEELEQAALAYGQLASCRLKNARLPEGSRVDCLAEFKQ
jgi:hypothetical protein